MHTTGVSAARVGGGLIVHVAAAAARHVGATTSRGAGVARRRTRRHVVDVPAALARYVRTVAQSAAPQVSVTRGTGARALRVRVTGAGESRYGR
eukprot:43750-Eustigmatos_ZCMA.PRE.1